MKKHLLAGAFVAAMTGGSFAAPESRWHPASEAQIGWTIARAISKDPHKAALGSAAGALAMGRIGLEIGTRVGAAVGSTVGPVGMVVGAGLGAL